MSATSWIAACALGTWLVLFLVVSFVPRAAAKKLLHRWNGFCLLSRWEMFVTRPDAEQSVAWLLRVRRLESGGSLSPWEEVFCSVEEWKVWHFLWHPRGFLQHSLHRYCGQLGKRAHVPGLERTEAFARLLAYSQRGRPEGNGWQLQLSKVSFDSGEDSVVWESKLQVEPNS